MGVQKDCCRIAQTWSYHTVAKLLRMLMTIIFVNMCQKLLTIGN